MFDAIQAPAIAPAAVSVPAARVAAAIEAEKMAGATLADARGRHTPVVARQEAMHAEIAAIGRRRAAGDLRPDDGQRAELLALDGGELVILHAETERAVAEAARAHAAAAAELYAARLALAAAEDLATARAAARYARALGDAAVMSLAEIAGAVADHALARGDAVDLQNQLTAVAQQLDAALLAKVAEINRLGPLAGRTARQVYCPSDSLWLALRRLQPQLLRL